MGLLELNWGHHPKGAVEPVVVLPVDPASGGVLVVTDAVRPGEKDGGADALGLVETITHSMSALSYDLATNSIEGWTPSSARCSVDVMYAYSSVQARWQRNSERRNRLPFRSVAGVGVAEPLARASVRD